MMQAQTNFLPLLRALLLSSALLVSSPAAWTAEDARGPQTTFSMAMRSDYQETDGVSDHYASLAATGQLRFRSPSHYFTAALLVELSAIEDRENTTIIAGMFIYKMPKWTLSAAPYVKKTADAPDLWRHQTTVRYQLAPRHALGIELYGPLSGYHVSKAMLGYYGKISGSVSFNTTIGSGIGAGPDLTARTSVVWHLR
jgi:hypothetical protein